MSDQEPVKKQRGRKPGSRNKTATGGAPKKSTKSAKSTKPSKSNKSVAKQTNLEENENPNVDDLDFDDENQPVNEEDEDDDQELIPDMDPIESLNKLKEHYEYRPELRKEIIIIHPDNRITSEIMTKFERTEVISIRSRQIENGGNCFVSVDDLTDPIEMAIREMQQKRCPCDILRARTDKIYERWHVNELANPYD
jgi:DNA-directed RNA polymerase subunit K/omega